MIYSLKAEISAWKFGKKLLQIMCLGAPGLGTPCCGNSGVRGLSVESIRVINELSNICHLMLVMLHGLMCVPYIIDEQVEAVRSEMAETVARLETELSELQQSRTALQQDSAQQLESLERLRCENAELQQRVSIMLCYASLPL